MFTLQVRAKKNLSNNNRGVQVDAETTKKLSMNGSDDLILHCELRRATQCALSDLIIMWYQEDINEHLALSFLSAVTVIDSWYARLTQGDHLPGHRHHAAGHLQNRGGLPRPHPRVGTHS